jgi:hypothetical protein
MGLNMEFYFKSLSERRFFYFILMSIPNSNSAFKEVNDWSVIFGDIKTILILVSGKPIQKWFGIPVPQTIPIM